MISNFQIFKKVTIVGVGLMGGSMGMAIKKHGLAKEVVGLSHRQSSLMQALEQKAIDIAESDVQKAIRNADLVILAAPVDSIIKLLTTINPYLRRNCIVTDTGSAKGEIVETAVKVLSNPSAFVGTHPLVGSEQRGVKNAHDDLFEGSACIMTPSKQTSQFAKEKIKLLWNKLGAQIHVMTPEEHDEVLAYISHLPHFMAYGLMETIPEKYLNFATQGLMDMTRIASSSPQMWNDICMSNSKYILKALDELIQQFSELRKVVVRRDQKNLIQHFTKAKEKRDGIRSN